MSASESQALAAAVALVAGRLRETGRFFRTVREAENVVRVEPLATPFDPGRLGAITLSAQGPRDFWAQGLVEVADQPGAPDTVAGAAHRIDPSDDEALAELADQFAPHPAAAA